MPALGQHRGLFAGLRALSVSSSEYADKLSRMVADTLLPVLDTPDREFIRSLAEGYRFTFQELRQVSQAARDLEMWREGLLKQWWEVAERNAQGQGKQRKKAILQELRKNLQSLGASEKSYPESGLAPPPRRQIQLQETKTDREVLGLCPAHSDQTICCGLHTLDAVRGCPFSCSYCTIQTFYGETAELEADLAEKLAEIDLDPTRRYHIGTGQASDSLVWGNRGGLLDALLAFAKANPNVLLELKSKSNNITYLAEQEIPANVVCSWTLNTDTVIRNEEMGSSSLRQRLQAARVMADRGVPVSFHFHPMVYYQGWELDYPALAMEVVESFSPEEISFVSMGTVTMIKPVVQAIRRRGGETKILQMDLVPDHHGKLTYPDEIKLSLFRTLYSGFAPWHQRVFFYLCMETAAIWREVLGSAYDSNRAFETDFLDRCLPTRSKVTC